MDSSIYDHSPWLVSEDRFLTVKDHKTIESLLLGARDSNAFLTLFDNDLNLHFKSVLIRINADAFQIDKPIEWDGQDKEFQIFFQDSAQCWNMIKAEFVSEELYAVTVAIPENIYHLQKRRAPRVEPPADTTASFIANESNLGNLQVVNLSRSGMLVCGLPQERSLPLDSVIREITITLPKIFSLPPTKIDQGKIVRAFHRINAEETCHGISFTHDVQSFPLEMNGILPRK